MPNLNAALACAQLEKLQEFIEAKRAQAKEYKLFFDNLGVKFREEPKDSKSNYWLMSIELEDKKARNEFLNFTNKNGVMTRPIWKLMYKLDMYKNCYRDDQKNAEYLEDRIVNIASSVK